ncbi:MAG: M48 family metallopeptidase [Promethearchaeota archaeon]
MFNTLFFHFDWSELIVDWIFIITTFLYLLTIEEFYHWVRNNKRSEMSDIVAIAFFFFLILFFTKDFLTSLMGAFSIYLWIGIFELKDYPILNKILIISLVTYNIIFFAGIISYYQNNSFFINTAFAFSFWIILIMGFVLFGRKYLIVWRFMSPEYLTLFLYIIAWLAVTFLNQYTALNFTSNKPLNFEQLTLLDFFMNIYFILVCVNWIIYFISGSILDKMLGIKRIKDKTILKKVTEVKNKIGIKGKVKVGYGKYPILNAMAYGSFFDNRIAIIAEDLNQIPNDELNGIIAHELAHTKGHHTLILTIITTGDLLVRMILGIPATLYDYTFGNPQIPMIAFIFLNIAIYILLFIFVRILEGKADLKAKKAGYARELTKALYNLESFYATGREIGLNTMLLCDEKITKDNQLLDYMNTAIYLHHSMIKPSRASLISNFINSHPPSYHRIAALLSNDLKPSKEAILPFICLKQSNQKKYARKFKMAREQFKLIANEKFKEFFKIDDISSMMVKLKRNELYKFEIQKDFVFRNLITDDLILGKLDDVEFVDDISDPIQFIINDTKNHKICYLNSSTYLRIRYDINAQYFLQKDQSLTLTDVVISNKTKKPYYLFMENDITKIQKSILKTHLPISISQIDSLKNQEIFLKSKGTLKRFKCTDIIKADNLGNFQIELSNIENKDKEPIKYTFNQLIIRPKRIYLNISRRSSFRESEVDIIKWLSINQLQAFIYLKKPVNNIEIGYIQNIEGDLQNSMKNFSIKDKKNENALLIIKNIFGKEVKIPYKQLETIYFEYDGALIQIKSATSFTSRLGYKLLKRFKPERIIMT